MEIKPPCVKKSRSQIHEDRKQAGGATYDVVVLAADNVGRASVARANTNDGDGRAAETEQALDALEDDAEQAKDGTEARIVSLQKHSVRCAFACMG